MRLLVLIALACLLLAAACSSDDGKSSAGRETPAAGASAVANRWDAATVWPYSAPATAAAWQQACGGRTPSSISANDPCVLAAMRASNADPSAVDFYQSQGYFLASFSERGRVDYGQGGAPWFNMGRPTPQLFLNGSPDIIEAPLTDDYKTNPTYAALLGREARASPWLEYGVLRGVTAQGGRQVFTIEYPLRACRACEDLGYLPVTYPFDAQGRLGTPRTEPLRPK